MSAPILELRDIRKEYRLRQGVLSRLRHGAKPLTAVDGVSFAVPRGSIFGLVGESGSGKSTLAQIIVRLIEPTGGALLFDGQDVAGLDAAGGAAVSAQRADGVPGYRVVVESAEAGSPGDC